MHGRNFIFKNNNNKKTLLFLIESNIIEITKQIKEISMNNINSKKHSNI